MILLAMTLCLTDGNRAECNRQSRYVASISECREIGKAMKEYISDTAKAPGISVRFSAECGRGNGG